MGSWVSHLPDRDFERVVGHGLNADELAANDRYDEWFVQDLNTDPVLEEWSAKELSLEKTSIAR